MFPTKMDFYSNTVFILWICCSWVNCILFGPENPIFLADPITEIACGLVKGLRQDGAYSFRGIPYAQPPVGQLRWSPPRPLSIDRRTCWSGVLDAREFGSQCYQRNASDQTGFSGNEDCLYLNIWAPSLNKMARLLVMVWVHGGSLQNGNANTLTYMPTAELSKKTNFVYVGMNYGLQAFGFMALEILSTNSTTGKSGNYGLMDIIEALRWVQNNIHNFGGDPTKVTIFGQSSGGTAVFALLASALSKGLFHQAWLSSASPVLNKTARDAFKDNSVFLNNTGFSDIDCLYKLSPPQVTAAAPWDVYPYWSMEDMLDLPVNGRFDGAMAIVDAYPSKSCVCYCTYDSNSDRTQGRKHDFQPLFTIFISEKPLSASAEWAGIVRIRSINARIFLQSAAHDFTTVGQVKA